MPRSRRSSQTGWWPGQYHRRAAGGSLTRLISAVLPIILLTTPAYSQNLLNIRILEGEGAIHGAAARAGRPIVVEVTDETGKPVDGAAVSFRMPEEGPGASFGQNMKTDIRVTTPDGKAVCSEFTTGRLPGPFQVRVTAVKSQIRAGVIVSQYVSDGPVKNTGARRGGGGGSKKWLIIAAIAGGVGAGIAAGSMGGKTTPGNNGPGPTVPATPPTIGAPSINVGGTQ